MNVEVSWGGNKNEVKSEGCLRPSPHDKILSVGRRKSMEEGGSIMGYR